MNIVVLEVVRNTEGGAEHCLTTKDINAQRTAYITDQLGYIRETPHCYQLNPTLIDGRCDQDYNTPFLFSQGSFFPLACSI